MFSTDAAFTLQGEGLLSRLPCAGQVYINLCKPRRLGFTRLLINPKYVCRVEDEASDKGDREGAAGPSRPRRLSTGLQPVPSQGLHSVAIIDPRISGCRGQGKADRCLQPTVARAALGSYISQNIRLFG